MAENFEISEARLCAYIDGELDADGRAEIEKLLAANPRYAAVVQDLVAGRDMLRRLPREPAPPELAEAFNSQLERQVLLADVGDAQSARPMRAGRWGNWMALAAIVILSVGLGALVYIALPPSHRWPVAIENPPAGPLNRGIEDGPVDKRKYDVANPEEPPAASGKTPADGPNRDAYFKAGNTFAEEAERVEKAEATDKDAAAAEAKDIRDDTSGGTAAGALADAPAEAPAESADLAHRGGKVAADDGATDSAPAPAAPAVREQDFVAAESTGRYAEADVEVESGVARPRSTAKQPTHNELRLRKAAANAPDAGPRDAVTHTAVTEPSEPLAADEALGDRAAQLESRAAGRATNGIDRLSAHQIPVRSDAMCVVVSAPDPAGADEHVRGVLERNHFAYLLADADGANRVRAAIRAPGSPPPAGGGTERQSTAAEVVAGLSIQPAAPESASDLSSQTTSDRRGIGAVARADEANGGRRTAPARAAKTAVEAESADDRASSDDAADEPEQSDSSDGTSDADLGMASRSLAAAEAWARGERVLVVQDLTPDEVRQVTAAIEQGGELRTELFRRSDRYGLVSLDDAKKRLTDAVATAPPAPADAAPDTEFGAEGGRGGAGAGVPRKFGRAKEKVDAELQARRSKVGSPATAPTNWIARKNDRLQMTCEQLAELGESPTSTLRVGEDGTVTLPVVKERVLAEGVNRRKLERDIAERYRRAEVVKQQPTVRLERLDKPTAVGRSARIAKAEPGRSNRGGLKPTGAAAATEDDANAQSGRQTDRVGGKQLTRERPDSDAAGTDEAEFRSPSAEAGAVAESAPGSEGEEAAKEQGRVDLVIVVRRNAPDAASAAAEPAAREAAPPADAAADDGAAEAGQAPDAEAGEPADDASGDR